MTIVLFVATLQLNIIQFTCTGNFLISVKLNYYCHFRFLLFLFFQFNKNSLIFNKLARFTPILLNKKYIYAHIHTHKLPYALFCSKLSSSHFVILESQRISLVRCETIETATDSQKWEETISLIRKRLVQSYVFFIFATTNFCCCCCCF